MARFTMLGVVALTAWLAAPDIRAEEKPGKSEVSYDIKKGDKFEYAIDHDTQNKSQSMDQSRKTSYLVQFEVKSVEKDGATLKAVFRRVAHQLVEFNKSYDSAKDVTTDDLMLISHSCLVNKALTVRLNFKGDVLSVSGMEDIAALIKKTLLSKHRIIFLDNPRSLETHLVGFDDTTMMDLFTLCFSGLPENPIAEGEDWKNEAIEHYKGAAIKIFNLAHKAASLDQKGSLQIVISGEVRNARETMFPLISSSISGKSEFDVKNGCMKSREIQIRYEMNVNKEYVAFTAVDLRATLKKRTAVR